MRRLLVYALTFALISTAAAYGRICPKCGRNHLPDVPPAPKVEPPKEEPPKVEPEKTEPKEEKEATKEAEEEVHALSVARARFSAPSVEIADEVDKILDRLVERYGTPRAWTPFPIYYKRYRGDGVAGYTLYSGNVVKEVVVYESFSDSVGGTLDHELTHAFYFYLLNSNFDLFLNEGIAQNSEYRRRESLRQTVYRRYSSGDFWELDKLYGRNCYDSTLLIYHQGFSVVDFLIGRGGSQWFTEFMRALVKSDNIDAELRRFYGYKSLAELQDAWREYIEKGQDRATLRAIR